MTRAQYTPDAPMLYADPPAQVTQRSVDDGCPVSVAIELAASYLHEIICDRVGGGPSWFGATPFHRNALRRGVTALVDELVDTPVQEAPRG